MVGIVSITFFMIVIYLNIRRLFNHWDSSCYLPIKKTEVKFFIILFYTIMLASIDKLAIGTLIIHMLNLVTLSFLAYTDSKTNLLYVSVLFYLHTQNLFYYFAGCIGNIFTFKYDIKAICLYIIAVLICYAGKAIAIGDVCIYIAMLPIILIMCNKYNNTSMLLLFLLIPLFLFLVIESGKAIIKNRRNALLQRKPFAPYLLAGYVICFLVYIFSYSR